MSLKGVDVDGPEPPLNGVAVGGDGGVFVEAAGRGVFVASGGGGVLVDVATKTGVDVAVSCGRGVSVEAG